MTKNKDNGMDVLNSVINNDDLNRTDHINQNVRTGRGDTMASDKLRLKVGLKMGLYCNEIVWEQFNNAVEKSHHKSKTQALLYAAKRFIAEVEMENKG